MSNVLFPESSIDYQSLAPDFATGANSPDRHGFQTAGYLARQKGRGMIERKRNRVFVVDDEPVIASTTAMISVE